LTGGPVDQNSVPPVNWLEVVVVVERMDPASSSTDGLFSMENDSLKLLDELDESIANGTGGEFAGVNAQVGIVV
jgi:hypothetical protein